MRIVHVAVIAVAVLGCRRFRDRHHDEDAQATSMAPSSRSIRDADALWKLAPADTRLAIVATPRAVGLLEGAARSLRVAFETAPELKGVAEQMLPEMILKVITYRSLADAGLTQDRGAALFSTPTSQLFVLPVGDRDKFVTTFGGTKAGDTDSFDGMTCRTVNGVYACANEPSLFEQIGKGEVRSKLELVKARGEIEGFLGLPIPNVNSAFAAQLAPGRFKIYGAFPGAIATGLELGTPAKPRVDAASTSSFAVADLSPYLGSVPNVPLAEGLSISDLTRSVGGPITATMAAGVIDLDVRIPLTDAAAAQKLIEKCPTIFSSMIVPNTPPGSCRLIPPQLRTEIDLWVEGNVLRIGRKDQPSRGKRITLSPMATEIANGEWSMAFWGRGTVIGSELATTGEVDLRGLRFLSLLPELGVAMRRDGDLVRAVISARTVWADPDDVVAKLLAIKVEELGDKTKAQAVADAAPTSQFAQDYASGYGGLMIPSSMAGMLSAVAVPMVMSYLRQPEPPAEPPSLPEAAVRLNDLSKNAKAAFAATGSFPVGEITPAAAAGCCNEPGRKCTGDATQWGAEPLKALGFPAADPGVFRYSYKSDGKTFTALAVADLDCDGTAITYTLDGSVKDGTPQTTMTQPAPDSD
ncbi:MAG: hypothetical protein AB7L28_04580 [Kofleriaceae bacterium]